jgi:hypothetical protein
MQTDCLFKLLEDKSELICYGKFFHNKEFKHYKVQK